MDRLRRSCALLTLAVFGLGACAFPGDSIRDDEGILGTYTVNGVDPVGVEYSGTVTIAETDVDGEYAVEWIVTGTIQQGTGRLVGDRFEVEWTSVTTARGDSSGTASYVVDDDGVLRGTRLVDGIDDAGTEEIFPEA